MMKFNKYIEVSSSELDMEMNDFHDQVMVQHMHLVSWFSWCSIVTNVPFYTLW